MKKPNILFLMTDQHRAEYVGYHPNAKMQTPNIDRIAEGAAFTRCISVNPICTPARVALLTGKYSHQVGMLEMSGDLSLAFPTYPQALQRAGYYTAGIGKFHFWQGWAWNRPAEGTGHPLARSSELIRRYGFDHEWEVAGKQLARQNHCHYCEHLERKGLLNEYRAHTKRISNNTYFVSEYDREAETEWPFDEEDYIDVVIGEKIRDAIRTRPQEKPFMLFGSFCGPHPPYDPPRRYIDMVPHEEKDDFIEDDTALTDEEKTMLYHKRRRYRAMIRLIDDEIGKIITTLEKEGVLDNTMIVFTADHGEMLGDHGRLQKGVAYREAVNVPLAIRTPTGTTGVVNDSPVELTDVTATILAAAGIDAREALSQSWPAFNDIVPARSLLPIIENNAERVRDYAFSEHNNNWQMIEDNRYKYIRFLDNWRTPEACVVREVLYDTKDDPRETINLAERDEYRDVLTRMRRAREHVIDTTPSAQTRWAPLAEETRAFDKEAM